MYFLISVSCCCFPFLVLEQLYNNVYINLTHSSDGNPKDYQLLVGMSKFFHGYKGVGIGV